jgi:hypothetical protein
MICLSLVFYFDLLSILPKVQWKKIVFPTLSKAPTKIKGVCCKEVDGKKALIL